MFESDETRNPFGMTYPCDRAVPGYGAVDADFHVVGDHPGAHGGVATGVPFTGTAAGERLLDALSAVGLVEYDDELAVPNCFLSYAHPCVPGTDGGDGGRTDTPTDADYDAMEPFLDAELRAVNAHVLLPVGDRALAYVLREHTTLVGEVPADAAAVHARQLRGRGFLVVPVRDPAAWTTEDEAALTATLRSVLSSDYRQTKGVATLVG